MTTGTRTALLVLSLVMSAGLAGCPTTKRFRDYAEDQHPPDAYALLSEQHVFGGAQVTIRRIDGHPLPTSIWRGTHWEVEVLPGEHVVEVGYKAPDSESTTNAAVRFLAEAGGRYEVRAARVKHGAASEFGKHLAASFWPWVHGEWVAWVVDTRTGAVVGGIEAEEHGFTTTLQPATAP